MFGIKKHVEEPVEVEISEPEVVEEKEPEFVPSKTTVIANGVTLIGDFETNDVLEIKGSLKGDVLSNSKVHVAVSGTYEGNAHVSDIVVDGFSNGNLVVTNTSEIGNTGSLVGSLATKKLITNPDAHFDGKLAMIPDRIARKQMEQEAREEVAEASSQQESFPSFE